MKIHTTCLGDDEGVVSPAAPAPLLSPITWSSAKYFSQEKKKKRPETTDTDGPRAGLIEGGGAGPGKFTPPPPFWGWDREVWWHVPGLRLPVLHCRANHG